MNGILQGLASGTFLYIVFLEILPHEFSVKRRYPNRMLKVLVLILGYSAVALIQFLDPSVLTPNQEGQPTPNTGPGSVGKSGLLGIKHV